LSSNLKSAARSAIRRGRLFPPGTRAGVAVSGGADSVALLFLLHELRDELGIVLRAVHLNHQLRGPASDADEAFVSVLAARLGLDCTAERADVRNLAQQHGWNLEDAGRRARQSFFEKLVADGAVDRVAVAHTADDQAETVLMHLLRGSGLSGLAGIHPIAGPVVRPLLEIRRSQLRAYLLARGESWREDTTNADTTRLRARIRHELLPLLEREYQPAIAERLGSLAALAHKDVTLLNRLVEECFASLVASGVHHFSMDAADLLAPGLPGGGNESHAAYPQLAGRLIRRLITAVRGNCNRISAGHVEAVLALAARPESGLRLELPGVVVEKRFGQMLFRAAGSVAIAPTHAVTEPYQVEVLLPAAGEQSTVVFPAGRLRLKAFDCPAQGSDTTSGVEALDADLLQPPLSLRNWRPGDAYRPATRQKQHKLKRLFWEADVPVEERSAWPVLTSAGRIAWARAFGVADEFAVRPASRKVLLITEEKL
jgi:tRNA(Ile)-lysidine synthase